MKIRVHHLYLFFHSIGSPTGVHPKVEEKMFHWSLMLQSLLKYLKVKVCLLNRLFIFTQLGADHLIPGGGGAMVFL